MVLPETKPNTEMDTPPELITGEAGEQVAYFCRPPIRDDAAVAGRQTQMWVTRQTPYLNSFLSSVERRIGIQVVGRGASSLTDSIMGFGPEVRGTEGNMVFYIHDILTQDDDEENEAEPVDEDSEDGFNDFNDLDAINVWKMHTPAVR